MNRTRRSGTHERLWLAVRFCLGVYTALSLSGQTRLEILDTRTQRPLAARVHLTSAGKPVRPPGLPFWRDHFVCPGVVDLTLEPGDYECEIQRGPEWALVRTNFSVSGTAMRLAFSLSRIADLASEGWWSGETHIHRSLTEAELLMRAEDLHYGHFITWWNAANPWLKSPPPAVMPVAFDGNCYFQPLGGEDERDGGALLFMDLSVPLEITSAVRDFPSSLVFAQQARARGARWIDAEKPFWWDFPMWVAHGVVDTVGIAHNHLHRSGVLDNEAWGRPRDRDRFAGPQGNGRWSQEIYYHVLNCGVRLPPSAGSASGVLPNPVGYNRAYVFLPPAGAAATGFSPAAWREGLKAGRSFVSNGPLLRARANGQLPGHIFQNNGPLAMLLEAQLHGNDPIAAVELVQNGQITPIRLPARIVIEESGWFLLRAIADVPNTFRFASTAPYYVELKGQPMRPRRESAEYFVGWCRERMTRLRALTGLSETQKEQLLQPWRDAEAFWQNKATPGQIQKRPE